MTMPDTRPLHCADGVVQLPPVPGGRRPPAPAGEAGSTQAENKYLPRDQRRGVALCLSGGGYRAALFHLGAIRRLNELGVLGKVDTITAASGGALLAAHLAARVGKHWPEPDKSIPEFEDRVAKPFHRLAQRNIRTPALARGFVPWNLFTGHAAVRALEGLYRRHLTNMRLVDLPERPNYVFCATDLTYGTNWIFTRSEIGGCMPGRMPTAKKKRWRVARAVAAASCFPPVFNPMPAGVSPEELDGPLDPKATGCRQEYEKRIRGLRLSDGGVYDNMALEPVWQTHGILLVSDGGATFDAGADAGLFWRLKRYVDVANEQVTAIRKRWLISNFLEGTTTGAYWGIGSEAANYDDEPEPGKEPRRFSGYDGATVDDFVSEIRTDFDSFSEPERFILENHGYLLADAAIRKHAPFLIAQPMTPATVPNSEWYPDEAGKVRSALKNSHRWRLLGR
jgi:NTE family protein